MATGTLLPWGRQEYADNNWNPLSGGTLRIDIAGTTTLATVYSNVGLTSAITNPITLNAAGRPTSDGSTECSIFGTPGVSYKYTLKDSSGSTIWTQDNILSIPSSSLNNDIIGTAGETLSAGKGCYLSDGSAGTTAGLWYLWDNKTAYSCMAQIGMAPNEIASGNSGTIRLNGSMTGLTGLTVGQAYQIGLSGALSTFESAGSFRRFVGQADSTTSLVFQPASVQITFYAALMCEGRLTLTSATPVTTSDVTGATTVYFTPYKGSRIALYDTGIGRMYVHFFDELSLSLGTVTSGLPYDLFVYTSAGTMALEKLAWTNATTRATALTTQSGVLVKSGALDRRYVGTIYTTSTTATEDSLAKRFVFNYYNRVNRPMRVTEATDSWVYSSATVRQANGSTSNQLAVMVGWPEESIALTLYAASSMADGPTARIRWNAIGEDSTTAMASGCLTFRFAAGAVSGALQVNTAFLTKNPAVGYHYYAWLEAAEGAGETDTWYGDNGAPTTSQSGIQATWRA